MDSSLFHRALHSLQNPRLRFHHHPHHRLQHINPTDDNPAKQVFEAEVCHRLSNLQIPHTPGQGWLTLSWLSGTVKLVRFTCTEISHLPPEMSCTDKEKSLLEANLEQSLKLLDVCNGLKEALDDVQHYVMLVRHAARSAVDVKNAALEDFNSKVARLHAALRKSAEFMHSRVEENSRHKEGRSKLETCSSLLGRMDEPFVEAFGKQAVPHQLFRDLYAVKVLAIFVFGVISIALSVKPKRPLSCLRMAEEPTWLVSLQSLQNNVKSITDDSIQGGKVTILKELDEVLLHVNQLFDLTKSLQQQETSPTDQDRMNLGLQCEKLSEESEALQKGFHDLQQHIDGIFRMVISIRVIFLDALCHT